MKLGAQFLGSRGPFMHPVISMAPTANTSGQAAAVDFASRIVPLWQAALGPELLGYLRTLLYPGRFCYSWMTGRMGSNDEAVAFLGRTRPAQLDVSLITRALQCRQADVDPDSLFSARTTLPSQVDACAALVAGVAPQG